MRQMHNFGMIAEKVPGIEKLKPAEKLMLVSEIWDDLAQNPSEVSVPREVIEELDRRIAEYERNPEAVTTWEEMKIRILHSKK